MKQLKRFVCVLIVLVMCAGTLPILALAEEEPDTAPVTEGDSVSDQPGEGEAEFLGEGDTDTPTEPADSEEPEEPDEAQPYSWYDAEAEEYADHIMLRYRAAISSTLVSRGLPGRQASA